MDEALRKRLDAIVALLAVIAFLLAGVVVAVGGGDFLAMLLFVGAVLGLLTRMVFPDLQGAALGSEQGTR
jgi:fucose permease